MSRLSATFAACKADNRAALIGYLTAGDPDPGASRERIFTACEAGLDILELGLPFSDPAADGPTIQAAMVRALAAHTRVDDVLEICSAVRERFDLPVVLFSYANPLVRRGGEAMARAAHGAGADAMLVVDLPPEHAGELRDPARAKELDWVGLVAPTSPPARRQRVIDASTGFVYAVSLTGVTGTALDPSDPRLHATLDALQEETGDLPLAVGFGIRGAEQVQALAHKVDGIIVGSELVRCAQQSHECLAEKVRELASATRRG
jgi:tryptophan synthase alpha chain